MLTTITTPITPATFDATTAPASEAAADLLLLPVFEGLKPGPGLKEVSKAMHTDFVRMAKDHGLEGKPGEALALPSLGAIPARTVVLVGAGPQKTAGPTEVRRAAMTGTRAAKSFASVASTLPQVGGSMRLSARAFAEGVLLGAHRLEAYKSKPEAHAALATVTALVKRDPSAAARALDTGRIHGEASNWTRDLVNTPAADMTPARLAEVAQAMAKRQGLECKVWNRAALEEGGFGGILAVGRGSPNDPVMIELSYRGAANVRPYAITGKGITFDAGGLFVKKAKWMETMKDDMAGAAATLAVMRAAAELGLGLNLIAAIGSAENMPSGSATRPGDVVTHRGGKTSEVTDPDAEGRVLLADVLAYLSEKKPRCIIDSATLTGTGLGEDLWAGFSNDQELMDDLRAAGEQAGEPGWQFPLWKPYDRHNKSEVADVKNADWTGADTLSAGLFLQHFVGKTPWAHMDVGDTANLEDERDEWPAGPTGCPARTLIRYLENQERHR